MADIRRLEGDEIALTGIETRNPVRARELVVRYLAAVDAADLQPSERRMVAARLSGAEYLLARALIADDPARARGLLLRSAQRHPSALTGWGKAALALALGRRGFDYVLRRRMALDRS
jgi:hypothetical protein